MKKIGLDLDSVLAEIMSPLNNYHNRIYKTNHQINHYTTFDLSIVWNCTKEQAMDRVYEFYYSSDFDLIIPVDGAFDAINKLVKNYELIVITSRPHITQKKTDQWIKKYFSNNISKIIHTNQFSKHDQKKKLKSQVARELDISIFVEDNIEYANDCAINSIQTYLIDMPWNQSKDLNSNIIRVNSWNEIVKHLI